MIAEYGKLTRFGGNRNYPLIAQKKALPPWSVARAIILILRSKISVDLLAMSRPQAKRKIARLLLGGRKKATASEIVAINLYIAAIFGNLRAMHRLTELSDR